MKREPLFNVPAIVLAIVAALVAVHGWREYFVSDDFDAHLLAWFAFAPGRLTYLFDPDGVAAVLSALGATGDADDFNNARFFLGDGSPEWWTPLTYSFLHANWAHCGVNSIWLVAFGSPVAKRIGAARFLALFAAAAIAGAALHWLFHRFDFAPVIGASAAVSGAMAAACRFIFQPGGMVGFGDPAAAHPPLVSLPELARDGRAVLFLIFWFGGNLVFGLLSQPLGITPGPVAWEAHVGGFLAGFLLFPLLDPPAPPEVATTPAAETGPDQPAV